MKFSLHDEENQAVHSLLKLGERAVRVMEDAKGEAITNHSDVERLTVESMDNHVYYYAGVDSDRCLAMLREVRGMDSSLRNERLTRNIPDNVEKTPIWLHIHSAGGDLFAALAAADQLRKIQTPIYSIIEGLCASAATLLSLACKKRFITPSSFVLIHQFSSQKWGKYQEFKDEVYLMDMMMELLVKFYSKRTKLSRKKIRALLERDSWFNAQECLKYGFADEIL